MLRQSGEELGLSRHSTVYHYYTFSSYNKEMSARQQSSEQDEWQGN